MIQIHLDDDTELLLKTLMDHDKEKTATGMVRSLIRDGLRERRLWPVSIHAVAEERADALPSAVE